MLNCFIQHKHGKPWLTFDVNHKLTRVNLINKLSDHQPYFILLNNVDTRDPPPKFIKINKHNKGTIQNFHNEILTSNELTSINDDLTVDPNTT